MNIRPSLSNRSFTFRHVSSACRVSRMIGLSCCLTLLATTGIGHAAPTAYEPFDYALGGLVDGTAATGAGLSGVWTCGSPGTIVSGLTYTDLPSANNALQSAGARQYVSFSSPLSGGTKWISFLFKSSPGDPGANKNGVYFPNGGSGLFFGFGLQPYSSTQGQLGIGSMDTTGTSAQGTATLQLLGLGTYGETYLVAMEIQFNTSGNNDTVTVYLNPVANQATPGVAAAGTYATFDVGAITGAGLNISGAGEIIIDEIRVGDTYADSVDAVTVAPDAPTGLNATPGPNSVSLSWTAATGTPTSYNVKRSTSSGGPFTNVIGTTTAPTVTYNDSVLGGQTYYYVVSAENGNGESSDSIQAAATPILAAPDAPTNLSATPGDAQVSLSWNASAFATGYTVRRATDIAGPYNTIGGTTAPTVMYNDTAGLANGTTYFYTVSATGEGGSGPDTSPVSAKPFGPLPLVASIVPGAGITWFASNGVTYYVQWASENLGTNTVWNSLGESIPGNGETNTVFDPVGEPHNYYRVLSIQ